MVWSAPSPAARKNDPVDLGSDLRKASRQSYLALFAGIIILGAIIAAFALDGPEKCSGLEIVRYNAQSLGSELGPGFVLEEEHAEVHLTPAGKQQRFGFYRFRKAG